MIRFYVHVHEEGYDFCFHKDNLCDFSESTKSMLLKFSKCVNCGNNMKKVFSPCECTTKGSDKNLHRSLRYFVRFCGRTSRDSDKDWVTGYRMTKEQLDHIWPYIQEDRRRAYGRKGGAVRRERLSKAEGYHRLDDIGQIWELQKRKCYFCWRPLWESFIGLGETKILPAFGEWHKDHLTPISKGGTNWPYNIALTCKECNPRKSDRSEAFFWRLLEEEHGKNWVAKRKALTNKNRGAKRKLTNIRRKQAKSRHRGKTGDGIEDGKF